MLQDLWVGASTRAAPGAFFWILPPQRDPAPAVADRVGDENERKFPLWPLDLLAKTCYTTLVCTTGQLMKTLSKNIRHSMPFGSLSRW